jgi:hypothetical protein
MSEEKIKDFHDRHGLPVCLQGTNLLIFSDGASRENHSFGVLREPPENDFERYKVIAQYWETKLELSIEEFDNLKHQFLSVANNQLKQVNPGGPMLTPEEAEAELHKLKRKVQFCQKKLYESQAVLDKSAPKTHRNNIFEENKARIGDFIRKVSSIEI